MRKNDPLLACYICRDILPESKLHEICLQKSAVNWVLPVCKDCLEEAVYFKKRFTPAND